MNLCKDCRLWGTILCPPSHLCYAIGSKPHFEPKTINKFKVFINRILDRDK